MIKHIDIHTKIPDTKALASSDWEYGYNEEYDFVCISKDGTLGSIVEIQNLHIGLPKVPKNKKDILYHDLSKEKQKWRREDTPKGLRRDTEDMYEEYIDQEFDRREFGVWFYNNGTPTYITGSHYFYLQHFKIDIGYPEYREINKWFYWFWEACIADERCYGMCYLKNRRSGFSYMAASEAVNKGTLYRNRHIGIISKTGDDARSFFRTKVGYGFRNLISPFVPLMDGTTNPKEQLNFTEPAQRITKNKKYVETTEGLETIIDYKTTQTNSYDSEKIAPVFIIDEAGKWPPDCKITDYWEVAKTCLEIGIDIVGKAMLGSTSNAMNKGGKEFKQIYEESDVTDRDENGQTLRGLYSLFISAEYNLEGFFDEYGISIVETPEVPVMGNNGRLIKIGSREFLEKRRRGKRKNAKALNEELRKYPMSEREAFMDEIGSTAFNIQKIEEQRAYLDLLRNKQNPVLKGRFEWTDGFGSDVIWTPDSHSYRFKVTWLQEPELRNKKEKRGGSWYPPNGWMGVGGLDPYAIDTAAYGGSKGAIYFFNKDNPRAPSNAFVLQYIHRPPAIVDFYEDALKAAIYYGYPILIENSKYEIATHFINWGYGHYLLSRPRISLNPLSKPSPAEMAKKGIPATVEIIRQLDNYTDEYINKYVGYNEDGEIGDGVYFDELLEDWKQYNPQKRTSHDSSVAAAHALYASKIRIDGGYDDGEKKKTPLLRTYRV